MGLGGEEIAAGCAVAEQATSLRIAQRHLPGIRMWFEEGGEMEVDALAAGEEEGGARGASSSTIKAVYSEAWGEDDGRFDGLDFLFTLCAAPRDNASTPGAEEASEDDDGECFVLFPYSRVGWNSNFFSEAAAVCSSSRVCTSDRPHHTITMRFSEGVLHFQSIPELTSVGAEIALLS